jgi:hypothetical protein
MIHVICEGKFIVICWQFEQNDNKLELIKNNLLGICAITD